VCKFFRKTIKVLTKNFLTSFMIYDFLYAFCYQLNEKLKSNDSKFYAGTFVIIVIFFHAFFVIVIFKSLTGDYIEKTIGSPSSKYVFLPFVLIAMWILERLFKRRAGRIITRYESRSIVSMINGLLIFCIVFLPLLIGVMILKK